MILFRVGEASSIILERINSSADLKKLDESELDLLCAEIRHFLIDNVSKTGGHLSSNLGVVELTVAIHRVFDSEKDRIIFDVGHQSYVHKLLTGRRESFSTLRTLDGLSGFPKPSESINDAFIAGHASNSASVALGMARARTYLNKDYNVVAVMGDGALTGGLAYEALNDAGESKEPLIIILNDNGMSITQNVGGISAYLTRQRVKPSYFRLKQGYRKITHSIPGGKYIYNFSHRVKQMLKKSILPCSMFEDMGFTYLGPVDGHDINKVVCLLEWARHLNSPVLLQVSTIKGKGYEFSEQDPETFHGISKFDVETGKPLKSSEKTFSDEFGEHLMCIAQKHENLCAITAAMTSGTGLSRFAWRFPDRFFDVGIAEQHAVAMGAGMAKQGMVPVIAIYSTFLQRAYDMLIHDVAIDKLHVVFCVDRAGLTGEDGETHQGVFDVAFLSQIPGMKILCPSNFRELDRMLEYAVSECDGPVAVRYPRGTEGDYTEFSGEENSVVLTSGNDFTVVSYGILINNLLEAAAELKKCGIAVEVIKLNVINPLEFDIIEESVKRTKNLLVLEDCVSEGCIGVKIAARIASKNIDTQNIILKNSGMDFVPHGSVDQLQKRLGIDSDSVAALIRDTVG